MINRKDIINQTLAKIREKMPDETIDRYKDIGKSMEVSTISTGSLAVDTILGGGFAVGRLNEIVGVTSSGKTTLALTAIANYQKDHPDANIMYIDAENAMDPSYARSLGVNLDEVVLFQPDSADDGYTAAEMFVNSGVADIIVIDSIAAMVPKALLEVNLGEQPPIGYAARFDLQGISRLLSATRKNKNTTIIFINQFKPAVKINPYAPSDGISNSMYQSGGPSLPFYFSQMIETKKSGKIFDENNEVISQKITVNVLKNKIAPPYRQADLFITFGRGIDKIQEVFEYGITLGLISLTGRTYEIPGVEGSKSNGKLKMIRYLEDNKEITNSLYNKIKEMITNEENKTNNLKVNSTSNLESNQE